jgi:uncharacterized membrane protein YbhN (UPF0104 family)
MRPDDTNSVADQRNRPHAQAIAAQSPLAPAPSRFDRRRIAHLAGTVLSLGLFALSLFVLARVVANLNLSDLRAAIVATSAEQIAGASLATILSYLALTGYDAMAMRQLRLHVPYRTTSLGSFTSYAISFTLGFPLITGGTVRYWIYSRAGLSAGKVASVTIIAGFTFWIGMAAVVATSLIFAAPALANLDLLAVWINQAVGFGIAAAIIVYLFWVSRSRRRVRFQGFRLELPGVAVTLGQMVLGVTDLCAAAGVLYILLPAGQGLDFISFLGLYVFACMLGIVSHAPGGIGVFEATMLRFIPGASEEKVIAALLLFRVIYYLVPFVLALALLGANESLRRWTTLREAMSHSEEESEGEEA